MIERRNLVSWRVASRATAGLVTFGCAGSIFMGRLMLLMNSLALSWYLTWPGMVGEIVKEVVIEQRDRFRCYRAVLR